ncbi:hypothetical protein PHMEG_00012926 [Phytophthora megakarya]|uniref:Uncharacterized protein n=1 Tax=Phytophthora megakarya TaxID=4795 RepID=A0A225W968_9STRA|nr:hypothetical protein PHMEG_00012926 [Phytophthora megakarya]
MVMGLTAIGGHTADPESTRILVAGGVLRARGVAKEDIPRITASSCVADVENCMTWENDARRGGIRYEPSVLDTASRCGELHGMGKCPMEEFYNQIRQWFNPTKHMGMLPEAAEKMLN